MARESLISSTRFGGGFGGLKFKPLPFSRGGAESATSPIPLNLELAFERGEISGRSYKEIVDQAIETVAPGTNLQRQLLREQSMAIRRIREEEERALREGRKLRRLQAEVKASSTPGKTYQDSVNMFNFWIQEAEKAQREGDMEYALEAYRNAGNQRDVAESRLRGESAAAKTLNTPEAKQRLLDWEQEDKAHEDFVRKVDMVYQQGQISGTDADKALLQGFLLRKQEVQERLSVLTDLQKKGITKIGRSQITTLLDKVTGEMTRKVGSSGAISPSVNDVINGLYDRVNNVGNYVDVVKEKNILGGLGPERVLTVERRRRTEVGNNFIQDEFGRFTEFKSATDEKGNKYFFAEVPFVNPDGSTSIKTITASGVKDPDSGNFVPFSQDTKLEDLATLGYENVVFQNESGTEVNLGKFGDEFGGKFKFTDSPVENSLYEASGRKLEPNQIQELMNNAQVQTQEGSESLLERVGKFLTLPQKSPAPPPGIDIVETPAGRLAQPKITPPPTVQGRGEFPIKLPPPVVKKPISLPKKAVPILTPTSKTSPNKQGIYNINIPSNLNFTNQPTTQPKPKTNIFSSTFNFLKGLLPF